MELIWIGFSKNSNRVSSRKYQAKVNGMDYRLNTQLGAKDTVKMTGYATG